MITDNSQHLFLINKIMNRIEQLDESRIDNNVITSNGFLYKHPYFNKQIWCDKLQQGKLKTKINFSLKFYSIFSKFLKYKKEKKLKNMQLPVLLNKKKVINEEDIILKLTSQLIDKFIDKNLNNALNDQIFNIYLKKDLINNPDTNHGINKVKKIKKMCEFIPDMTNLEYESFLY